MKVLVQIPNKINAIIIIGKRNFMITCRSQNISLFVHASLCVKSDLFLRPDYSNSIEKAM